MREIVLQTSGIVLSDDKDYLLNSRLSRAASQCGLATATDLVNAARRGDARAVQQVVECLTTNETSFFRDNAPFQLFRETLVPAAIAARKTVRSLTVWSAASSTGQEIYSLAMLLREHFPELETWRLQLHATDLSEAALEQARAGRYRLLEVNRGLPAQMLVKYFDQEGLNYVVKPEIRQMVSFRQFNLLQTRQLPFRPDIVFLRNVLIYFDVATKRQILRDLREVVNPGAMLVLGAVETTLNIDAGWERKSSGNTSYYTVSP